MSMATPSLSMSVSVRCIVLVRVYVVPGKALVSAMSSVWLVEDLLSKQRLNQEGITAIALLGTHICDSLIEHLTDNYSSIYLALDNDATAKALRWKYKIGYLFEDFTVVLLTKDIKDMDRDAILALVSVYYDTR